MRFVPRRPLCATALAPLMLGMGLATPAPAIAQQRIGVSSAVNPEATGIAPSAAPRTLLVGQKRVEGFWLSEWSRHQGVLTMLRLFRQITSLIREGVATTEVGATYPLDQVHEAVRQAETPARKGKVLLRIGAR